MYTLTEKEFKAEAEPILRRVFSTDNPFASHPFAETIPERRVLFGDEYDLKNMVSPLLLDALIAAASSVGDTGCYFTMLWRMNEEASGRSPAVTKAKFIYLLD